MSPDRAYLFLFVCYFVAWGKHFASNCPEIYREMEDCCPGGVAAAVLNLQPETTLPVTYHQLYGSHDDLILLEVDQKLLDDVLHQRVFIRGQSDEDAVLCTQSKTYAMKFVGTSNSVFLIPPSNQVDLDWKSAEHHQKGCEAEVASVLKLAPGNIELVEIAPKLDKLRTLLSKNYYQLDDTSEMEMEGMEVEKPKLYRWSDLVNEVQASDDEIKAGLQAISAVEIDGYWRLMEESSMDMVLRLLLSNSVLNDWRFHALNEDNVVLALVSDGFPHVIARHCLTVFADEVDGIGGTTVWKLNEKQVCVHFARGVLREGKMRIGNFMEKWMKRVPEGMQAKFEMLEGEVLTEKLGVETWIRPFRVSSLPSEPSQRFSILFSERPRWDSKDLNPYIRDLTVPGVSLEGLLLKYTRRVQASPDAEPVFTAR